MKTFLFFLDSLVVLSILAGCAAPGGGGGQQSVAQSDKPRDLHPNIPPGDLEKLAAGNRDFAFRLYQQVRAQPGNLFFSPHSISVALAMTYAGAAGATAGQMRQALGFGLEDARLHPAFNALQLELASREKDKQDPKQTNFRLAVVNALWGQSGYAFLPAFLDQLSLNYAAGMRLLDFKRDPESARKVINDWVAGQTADKVKDLIPSGSLDTLTRLVLTNAIYFNAPWLNPFQEAKTKPGAFTLLDGSQVTIPMMASSSNLSAYQGDGLTAVELPYTGGQVSMVLLVPDAGKLPDFEKSLTPAQWDGLRKKLQFTQVNLALPKFKFSAQFNLNDPLQKLGMRDAFLPDVADFSGMDGSRSLYITSALHKAFINVDEKGTEAAAATAVVAGVTSMPAKSIDLKIDRPFLFLIQDRPTGEILFLGRVTNPAQ